MMTEGDPIACEGCGKETAYMSWEDEHLCYDCALREEFPYGSL